MYLTALQVGGIVTQAGDFPRVRALLCIRQRYLGGCADSRAGRKGRLNIALRHGLRCYSLRSNLSRSSPYTHLRFHLAFLRRESGPRHTPCPLFSFFLSLFLPHKHGAHSLNFGHCAVFSSLTFHRLFALAAWTRAGQGNMGESKPQEARNNSTGREQREAWQRTR